MRVLVVGGGGREHALVWKLSQSKLVKKIYAAPGNAGIAELAECADIAAHDLKGLADFAQAKGVDLTVVGPELPLTLGIVDEFEQRGLRIFGPSKSAAQIEGSKVFAKEFMKRYHIPTASFRIFDSREEAVEFAGSADVPIVIKADGLAAGKGVVIPETKEEAEKVIDDMMLRKVFQEAGSKIVIEHFLEGEELTVMAFTDGEHVFPMLSSQDHKKIYDGNKGPNTGGMGAYAPTRVVSEGLMETIGQEILEPVIEGLNQEGRVYKGVFYAGLMITDMGPKVLEFNCRFGDPEAQAVLPLLESDLAEIFCHIVEGDLRSDEIKWQDRCAVCVVLASGGYPEQYEKGKEIKGLRRFAGRDVLLFHAGTRSEGNRFYTNGGRVLGVTAVERTLPQAIEKVYDAAQKISFEGMQYRKDIGARGLNAKTSFF
jgi:phosphoribosylamine--glycine ligase